MTIDRPPDGIVITISASMIKEKGYRNWLGNFLRCMSREACSYWMRQGARPKKDNALMYVYLVIGNRVRYRAFYGGSRAMHEVKFDDGRQMYAKAWVILSGPVERAPENIPMKGFRGFRYTHKLF